MQEKRNIRRLILFAVLVIATAIVMVSKHWQNTSWVDATMFRPSDLSEINRVTLTSGSDTVSLAYDGRWRVNGEYDADRSLIEVLFATLQQATPRRPVASAIQDSVSEQLDAGGVEVALYNDDVREAVFIAGGNQHKTQAYFKEPGKSVPYVVTIPGYRVYVSGIFEVGANGWRDKYVFGFNWRNFQQLQATFPDAPDQNFTVEGNNGTFGVREIAAADTARLNDYLDGVSLLTVDEYVESQTTADSLRGSKPMMTIKVTALGDHVFTLSIFGETNDHKILGLINNTEAAYFTKRKLQPVVRSRAFFVPKNSPD